MTAQGVDVSIGSRANSETLRKLFLNATKASQESRQIASTFIKDYNSGNNNPDYICSRFRPDSSVYWPISNSSLIAMESALSNRSNILRFHMHLKFTRFPRSNEESKIHTFDHSSIVYPNLATTIVDAINTPNKQVI
jgi:hypothetical protein